MAVRSKRQHASTAHLCLSAPSPWPLTDWRKRTILEFRVLRKRALRQTLERLARTLGRPYAGTPERPVPVMQGTVREEL